jgi:acetylornithine/N-succinyldiaminopimelate aminotransferase
MLGMELTKPGDGVVADLLAAGVLSNCTNQNVIRIVPPLIITTAQIDEALAAMRGVLEHHAA